MNEHRLLWDRLLLMSSANFGAPSLLESLLQLNMYPIECQHLLLLWHQREGHSIQFHLEQLELFLYQINSIPLSAKETFELSTEELFGIPSKQRLLQVDSYPCNVWWSDRSVKPNQLAEIWNYRCHTVANTVKFGTKSDIVHPATRTVVRLLPWNYPETAKIPRLLIEC